MGQGQQRNEPAPQGRGASWYLSAPFARPDERLARPLQDGSVANTPRSARLDPPGARATQGDAEGRVGHVLALGRTVINAAQRRVTELSVSLGGAPGKPRRVACGM